MYNSRGGVSTSNNTSSNQNIKKNENMIKHKGMANVFRHRSGIPNSGIPNASQHS
jgi:hypothetical protein